MKLASLTIRNFKAVGERPARIELRPITLIFGPNSAGKSSIIKALHYVRQVLEHHNLDPEWILDGAMDLGGFRNLVHRRDLDRAITIGLEVEDEAGLAFPLWLMVEEPLPELSVRLGTIRRAAVEFDVRWSALESKPYVARYATRLDGEPFLSIESTPDFKRIEVTGLNLEHPALELTEADPDRDVTPRDILSEVLASVLPTYPDSMNVPLTTGYPRGALPALGEALPLDCLHELDNFLGSVRFEHAEVMAGNKNGQQRRTATRLAEAENLAFQARNLAKLLSIGAVGPGELANGLIQRFVHIGAFRSIPPRHFNPRREASLGRWLDGAAAWDELALAPSDTVERVNDWLAGEHSLQTGYEVHVHRYRELPVDHPVSALLGSDDILDVVALLREELERLPTKSRIVFRDERSGLELAPCDVGVGLSQVLPIIVAATRDAPGLVAVEQPELHIHPRQQVELADHFAWLAIGPGQSRGPCRESDQWRSRSFLIETHSEHVILRLLRRIREASATAAELAGPALNTEDVAVHYVEPHDDGARVRRLRITEDGDFVDRWPQGFFEEREAELF